MCYYIIHSLMTQCILPSCRTSIIGKFLAAKCVITLIYIYHICHCMGIVAIPDCKVYIGKCSFFNHTIIDLPPEPSMNHHHKLIRSQAKITQLRWMNAKRDVNTLLNAPLKLVGSFTFLLCILTHHSLCFHSCTYTSPGFCRIG